MTIIEVNIKDMAAELALLVESVQKNGTWIRICKNGQPVADLRPAAAVTNPLSQAPELASVSFHEDPMLPLDLEEWPAEMR